MGLEQEEELKKYSKISKTVGWLQWDKATAQEKLSSKDVEEQKRGQFRMGQFEQQDGNWQESLDYFVGLQQLDKDFCADVVNLRIAEAFYKLLNIKEAFYALDTSAKTIKEKDRYMISLLRGKCFEKIKEFDQAVGEYQVALENAKKLEHDDNVVGHFEFRLGWSMIRQRDQIEQGVSHLISASELIPDNVEILLKLAGAVI